MSEIKWEDPPAAKSGQGEKGKWERLLAPLRERPGEWANVGHSWSGVASKIRRGEFVGIEAGEFDALSRNVDRSTGKGTLYVRYIGHLNGPQQ